MLYLVARAAPAARQPDKTALLNKIAQVARGGGFLDLGHGLVLRGTDAILEALFAAIEQAVTRVVRLAPAAIAELSEGSLLA